MTGSTILPILKLIFPTFIDIQGHTSSFRVQGKSIQTSADPSNKLPSCLINQLISKMRKINAIPTKVRFLIAGSTFWRTLSAALFFFSIIEKFVKCAFMVIFTVSMEFSIIKGTFASLRKNWRIALVVYLENSIPANWTELRCRHFHINQRKSS